VKSWPGFSYDIEASTNLAAWAFLGRLTVTNLSGSAAIADTNAHGSDHRFYRAVSH
jgi:hypothetical protein